MRTQTYSQRILTILADQEQKGKIAVFNRSVASRRFPKVQQKTSGIHGIIMRTARKMKEDSLLKRIGPGMFVLSARGRKVSN